MHHPTLNISEDIPTPDIDEDDEFLTFLSSNNSGNFSYDSSYGLIRTKELKLPHLMIDNVPRITCSQLANLLQDPTSHDYQEIIILDARFPYEYRGGHIQSSKNITSQACFKSIFQLYSKIKVCIICHCEFSKTRGPFLYALLRNHDRLTNVYPKLSIPEMYVLHGGYKDFYEQYPELCLGGYVAMRDKEYVLNGELKRCHTDYKKQMKMPFYSLLKRSKSTIIYNIHPIESIKNSNKTTNSFLPKNCSKDS
ncbi:m-phase inducer phosphatase [Tritrichomonas musculus]|uniref:protein-tyrosine-phosphatase n=1 Tax=Tritrichomonas musculus TaxID=1915356 RepID=A0ABR2KGF0_9EUKA